MGVGRGDMEELLSLWIFIHDIDKVAGCLIVLFFCLVFFRWLSLEIFLPTPMGRTAPIN